ncbi:family 43 glycosylhydrolase [Chitinophaga sp. sic0106]|uniref:family 43 glycosylhydrolase n=1 Tax=Chitinophaga sp. sic0106 TaxID=2854785 RepID=UPI001C440EF4|nr:family 43 glycosylhydrolase [Chitinophaga sp. sic0106]MBV7532125.1 family 43 glycosylhydrolase [Chitinophaga sp. sic0106]
MNLKRSLLGMVLLCLPVTLLHAQTSTADQQSLERYTKELTYVNPVLPGDHPDPTLLKVGDDFYHCGSSFHFNPYLPVYHSRDLVHWKIITRVLPPSHSTMVADKPSGGVWQGAITYFYGSYWIYFSSGGQWFSKAATPYGPWSAPVPVKTDSATGNLGYDNSIFVDDDGKPYMVIKNGQKVNRLRALNQEGQLTDTVINLDWINANLQYSWAEGPVMCKRNGYYYYFPAGDVSGGQYVLRATALTADSTKWERLGNFFKPSPDPENAFRSPNHITAPVQLPDGTWWTLGQSYQKTDTDDWSGMGRQTSLYQVIWEGDRPWGLPPVSTPVTKPNLPQGGITWRTACSDHFEDASLHPCWHFLNRYAGAHYSLTDRKGWIRLQPDTAQTHLVQKETDHFYTAITKVDLDASDTSHQAGIYLSNGNQKVYVAFYTGYDNGKKLIFHHDTATFIVANPVGKEVWLMVERNEHLLTASYSRNGHDWIKVSTVNSRALDRTQPNFNSWVGTSIGLFAKGKPADFDCFLYKDGGAPLPAVSYNNYYGIKTVTSPYGKMVTNDSNNGGWMMFAGIDLGTEAQPSGKMTLELSATANARLEVFLDSMPGTQPLATVAISSTQKKLKKISFDIGKSCGQHDVFIRFAPGSNGAANIRSLSFSAK